MKKAILLLLTLIMVLALIGCGSRTVTAVPSEEFETTQEETTTPEETTTEALVLSQSGSGYGCHMEKSELPMVDGQVDIYAWLTSLGVEEDDILVVENLVADTYKFMGPICVGKDFRTAGEEVVSFNDDTSIHRMISNERFVELDGLMVTCWDGGQVVQEINIGKDDLAFKVPTYLTKDGAVPVFSKYDPDLKYNTICGLLQVNLFEEAVGHFYLEGSNDYPFSY